MPYYIRGDISLYYEIHGRGFPLLLLAPGGMNSTIDFWQRTAINFAQILPEDFRVISMDQRNSGRSSAPLLDGDPWGHYCEDHVALLNHLGIERCLLVGACIGPSFAFRMLREAPERVVAAVLVQPIGISGDNRALFADSAREWAKALLERNPGLDKEAVERYIQRMWSGDFVFSVSREDVAKIQTPLLVMPGIDQAHPGAIGEEIGRLAPNAQVLSPWKEPASLLPLAGKRLRSFLIQQSGEMR